MTNYEKIMNELSNEMTIEEMAKTLIVPRIFYDESEEFELFFAPDDDMEYWSEEDAIKAEIKWLKQENDNE